MLALSTFTVAPDDSSNATNGTTTVRPAVPDDPLISYHNSDGTTLYYLMVGFFAPILVIHLLVAIFAVAYWFWKRKQGKVGSRERLGGTEVFTIQTGCDQCDMNRHPVEFALLCTHCGQLKKSEAANNSQQMQNQESAAVGGVGAFSQETQLSAQRLLQRTRSHVVNMEESPSIAELICNGNPHLTTTGQQHRERYCQATDSSQKESSEK